MTELSHAVFLSYASEDAEAAQRICEALTLPQDSADAREARMLVPG